MSRLVPGMVTDAAARDVALAGRAVEGAEAGARVDGPGPAVREANVLELREGGEEVAR